MISEQLSAPGKTAQPALCNNNILHTSYCLISIPYITNTTQGQHFHFPNFYARIASGTAKRQDMKTSLANRILLRCPIIYRHKDLGPKQNLMCFGFECGDGWFQLIYDLSASIEDIALQLKNDGFPEERLPAVFQVKEKFGGLRFYVNM